MGRLQRETGTVRKKDLHMKPFETSLLGRMELNNRIGIPAMCTYMAKGDGIANLHHIAHYETLAKGRPAFIVQEATAIAAEGYISDACLESLRRDSESH